MPLISVFPQVSCPINSMRFCEGRTGTFACVTLTLIFAGLGLLFLIARRKYKHSENLYGATCFSFFSAGTDIFSAGVYYVPLAPLSFLLLFQLVFWPSTCCLIFFLICHICPHLHAQRSPLSISYPRFSLSFFLLFSLSLTLSFPPSRHLSLLRYLFTRSS